MNKDLIKWAKGKVDDLKIKEKRNRKRYAALTIIVSVINLIVVALASLAIHALITAKDKTLHNSHIKLQLIMACVAAGVTILIFLLTIFTMIYRSVTKKDIYLKALDEIQVEIIKYKEKNEDYFNKSVEDPEALLKKNIENINNKARGTYRAKSFSQLVLIALSGGEHA